MKEFVYPDDEISGEVGTGQQDTLKEKTEIDFFEWMKLSLQDMDQIITLALAKLSDITYDRQEKGSVISHIVSWNGVELCRILVASQTDRGNASCSFHDTLMQQLIRPARQEQRLLTDEELELVSKYKYVYYHIGKAIDDRIRGYKMIEDSRYKAKLGQQDASPTGIMPPTAYQSVEIRIAKITEPHSYSVELSHPGSRDFPARKMILNSEDLLIHNINARDYGLLLGQALFADTALGDDFRESLAVLQREGKNLRLRLRLDDLDLHDIRWERLHYPIGDQWNPMAITASTPFSRYILAEDWGGHQPISQRPLRILVIIATPEDLNQYGLSTISQAERQAVHSIFDGLPDVVPTYLETGTATPPTLEHLRLELASGYHMVHFVCHGTVKSRGTVLYLEHEEGGVERVSAEQLVGSFRAVGTPPYFCFLAACESAAHSRFDAFMPLGPRLVAEGGFTAVVAMSDKVSLTTASKVTAQFYTRLLNHGYVDLAANEARASVQDNGDWSVPVLFSRLLDNRLLATSGIAHLEGTPSEKLKRQSTQQMSLSTVRRQLNQMFDDPELDAFCMDYFPQVYDKFSRGMRKDEKINLLLDHCRRFPDERHKLLAALEEIG